MNIDEFQELLSEYVQLLGAEDKTIVDDTLRDIINRGVALHNQLFGSPDEGFISVIDTRNMRK